MVTPVHQTRPVYTVSEITRRIKTILEKEFPLVWIAGEISNLRTPGSGHRYFTLKDEKAQINAVIFKGQSDRLTFNIENGQAIVGLGRVSVYEPRGTYQIIFEHLEPQGVGALQVAFDQLKRKLADEGLFDPDHKKDLPLLPRKIHIITSPGGAVVHDMIKIIQRRFANMAITIIPAHVQGDKAVGDITRALDILNHQSDAEIGIIARGGGSLEDLLPFNTEAVARAIFASQVPIVSAVGHETDFTIADFVADMRAPTPSAAAELAVPEKRQMERQLQGLSMRMVRQMRSAIDNRRNAYSRLVRRLRDPRRQIQEMRLKLDDCDQRLQRAVRHLLDAKHVTWQYLRSRLERTRLHTQMQHYNNKLEQIDYKLKNNISILIEKLATRQREATLRLTALNPLNVLERGYSITRSVPRGRIIKTAQAVRINQQVEVQLSAGTLLCRVEGKEDHGKKNV